MMWQIDEEQNQSHSSQEIQKLMPISKNQQVRTALSLRKLNQTTVDMCDDGQLDLEEYLDAQRANTQNNSLHPKKHKILTKEQKQMEKDYTSNYGMGFKMLQGMGFNLGKGLGKNQQGRSNIVQAEFKTSLTARDQQYKQPQHNQSDNLSEQTESQQQNLQELFLYKSKHPQINSFLTQLKNAYETLHTKLSITTRQIQSLNRDNEFSSSYKLQKQYQIAELDKQLIGLELINKDINKNINSNIIQVPQLGIKYQLDLLTVKSAIEKISVLAFPFQKERREYVQKVSGVLKQTLVSLTTIYLSKQKNIKEQYESSTAKQLFKNFPSNSAHNKNKSTKDINNSQQSQTVTTLSHQDSSKISKYLSMIIQETIIKDKLALYLQNIQHIGQCDFEILDLIQVIKKYDHREPEYGGSYGKSIIKNNHGKIIMELKAQYLVKLCNCYLNEFNQGLNDSKQILPHHVIFPWLTIIGLDQLDIAGFIYRVCSIPWKLSEDNLFILITPWLPYLPLEHRQFFFNFYLGPKLLNSYEIFRIYSESSQKSTLKHYIQYTKILSLPLREQILSSSIGLHILQTYKEFIVENNEQEVQEWARKWANKFDQISGGVIKKVFIQAGIQSIKW